MLRINCTNLPPGFHVRTACQRAPELNANTPLSPAKLAMSLQNACQADYTPPLRKAVWARRLAGARRFPEGAAQRREEQLGDGAQLGGLQGGEVIEHRGARGAGGALAAQAAAALAELGVQEPRDDQDERCEEVM